LAAIATAIKGVRPVRDRTLFWRMRTQDAVREGKWKYFRAGEQRKLFDLSVGQCEQADFSKKNQDVLERLSNQFDKWNQEMLARPSESES
jgi:hypothetical protein